MAIQILRALGLADEARKTLIEVFWNYPQVLLNSGGLAQLLLDF